MPATFGEITISSYEIRFEVLSKSHDAPVFFLNNFKVLWKTKKTKSQ